jgi:hypothetical protein
VIVFSEQIDILHIISTLRLSSSEDSSSSP